MRRCMVVLLVDALGHELVERSAVLRDRFPHRRRLETILGFSSGALPTLFSGRMPADHGRWLMYRRAGTGVAGDRRRSPFAGFEPLGLLPSRITRSGRVSRLLTRWVARRGVRGYFHLYDVPRGLLPEFDLPEREDVFAPRGLPVDSIWPRSGVPKRCCSATPPTSTRCSTARVRVARAYRRASSATRPGWTRWNAPPGHAGSSSGSTCSPITAWSTCAPRWT